MSTVTVLMTAYNSEAYVELAIESILKQTHQDFEFVIVDDESKDHTLDVIRSCAERDRRIKVIASEHVGVCKARNIGIEAAQGEWVLMMDSDDIALPNRLERFLQKAQAEPDVVVWGSYMTRINVRGEKIGDLNLGPTSVEAFNKLDRTQELIQLFNTAAMVRTDIFRKVGGYNEAMEAAEDSELWDRMAEYGPVVIIPEQLILYRLHDQSISMRKQDLLKRSHGFTLARNKAKLEGKTLTLEAYLASFKERPVLERFGTYMRNRSRYYGKMASIHWAKNRRVVGILSFGLAVLFDPFFITRRIWSDYLSKAFKRG